VNLCMSATFSLLESRMREILTSGSTRGEGTGLGSLPLLLYC
jgi:hypothetical protein